MSEEGWEDDDMADLFSFGHEEGGGSEGPGMEPSSAPVAAAASAVQTMETPAPALEESSPRERVTSNDSLLEMLDGDTSAAETSVLGQSSTAAAPMQDQDAQEILNWLDEEDTPISTESQVTTVPETMASEPKEEDETVKELVTEETVVETSTTASLPSGPAKTNDVDVPVFAPTIAAIPPPAIKPEMIHFDSLDEALDSRQSTIDHLRALFVEGGMRVDPKRRPALWSRTICGKSLEDLQASSLAESFREWQKAANNENDSERSVYIRNEADILAERVLSGASTSMTLEDAKSALCEVLFFYYQSSKTDGQEVDPLLPPVVCTLLSAGVSPDAASVMLTYLIPAFMPLLALPQEDRWEAAKSLHKQFYLLACYHLPLLVFHLDRYAPGWYWPKKLNETEGEESATEMGRNLQSHGIVPQSWLISHLAGECGGTLMNPVWLLSLWDLILTSSNNSLRFFLALAILEKYSDSLLMLTGPDLLSELNRIMEFKEGTTPEGFAIVAEEETCETEAGDSVQEWCDRARSLWEATPRSVVSQLRTAEDEAVKTALVEKQKRAEEEIRVRLEAEAKAHREAAEAEKERNAEEARLRLSRARLVAYYRTYNPEKEKNVDKIMEVYKGRLDVLDMKLKSKYGVSFKPALKPKSTTNPNTAQKLLSSMNQGLSSRRSAEVARQPSEDDSNLKPDDTEHQVAVKVLATEVLPIICWSKEAAASRGVATNARGRYNDEYRVPLKFYLVDSRPEATAEEQGRFPTAIVMSPEALLDPDRIQQQEEIFESLRGAVHICVMGEGFAAVPHLYNQKATPKLQNYIDEDESRTSLCALFFIKKGFPFVSVLDGGFVQAHSWLCREGPKRHLNAASVLVDYDETNSFFARLEKSYRTQQELANATAREKTQHVLQNLLDSSMTTLTRAAAKFETEVDSDRETYFRSVSKVITDVEVEEEETFVGSPMSGSGGDDEKVVGTEEESEGSFVSRFTGKRNKKPDDNVAETNDNVESSDKGQSVESAEPKFKNPFGGFRKAEATAPGAPEAEKTETDSGSTPVFRNPFAARRSIVPENEEAKENADEPVEPKDEKVEEPDLVDVSIAAAPTESNKSGTFSRFARAASSSIQKVGEQPAAQNALKRNPFARFGNKSAEKPAAVAESKKASNRFGGISMNQLRRSTLSSALRGRSVGDVDNQNADTDDLVEESISFDHDVRPDTSASTADKETKATEDASKAASEAVVEAV